MPNQNFTYDQESTMRAVPSRSSDASMRRIHRRYKDIDFAKCILEISTYLKEKVNREDWFDKYTVALRSLDPEIGCIGMKDYNLQALSYFWMLANDPAPTRANTNDEYAVVDLAKRAYGLFFSVPPPVKKFQKNTIPVQTKVEHLVHLMYECQRENNITPVEGSVPVRFEDNKLAPDDIACVTGVINNLCAGFSSIDEDIDVIDDDLNKIIHDLIKGFVADYCKSVHGISLKVLLVNKDDEEYIAYLVPEDVRAEIKLKIIKSLGGYYTDPNDLGLIGPDQEKYLDLCLEDDYFKNIMSGFDGDVDYLQAIIDSATNKLSLAIAANTTYAAYADTRHRFDLEHIQNIIKSISKGESIPAATRKSSMYISSYALEIGLAVATTVVVVAVAAEVVARLRPKPSI